jgi:hypothetical protein
MSHIDDQIEELNQRHAGVREMRQPIKVMIIFQLLIAHPHL